MLLEKSGEIASEGMKRLSQSDNSAQSGDESKVRCCNKQYWKGTWNARSMCAVLCLVTQLWLILCDHMNCSPSGFSVHGDSPGKNTGAGCHALLQGIFPTQGLNSGLPCYRWILYHLRHQGRLRILGWVAYPFSRGSPQPKNQTGISCIACEFFTN